MAGIDSTWGSTHLKRNEIFSAQIKEMLKDELMASTWVNWINDIPGDSLRTELKVNSIGELELDDWFESKPLPDRRMDTGQFKFEIDEFKGVKVPFTDHFFETSFQASEVLSRTPTKMMRAMDEYMEGQILALANSQTLDNDNLINGGKHRLVGNGDGTAAPLNALGLEDFAYAKYALKKAAVPMTGLVAVVTPETEYQLNLLTNLVNVSNNPHFEGIVNTGFSDNTGMRFLKNIYGFDVYVSDFLATNDANEATLTTAAGTVVADTAGYKSNIFMSVADNDVMPFIGAMGRTPKIASWRDDDIETEYHQLTSSFGLDLIRPESIVTILSNATI